MGASASVAGAGEALSTRAALLELMAAESQLSEDAADLTNMEDALAEVKRLRAFVKQVHSDFQADTQNR